MLRLPIPRRLRRLPPLVVMSVACCWACRVGAGQPAAVSAPVTPAATAASATPQPEQTAGIPLILPMTREQALLFPYTPPLSLHEAIALLSRLRAQGARAKADSPRSPARLQYMVQALNDTIDYVRGLDRRLTSLDQYDWHLVGRARVLPGQPEQVRLKLDRPILNVSAVAIRATRGRVLVEDVRARDAQDRPLAVDMGGAPYLVLQPLPKREVCFLYYPEEVGEVAMRLTTDLPPRGVVEVYLGASRLEEHGKLALYHMDRAMKALEAKRLEEFDTALREAERALNDFRWSHGI